MRRRFEYLRGDYHACFELHVLLLEIPTQMAKSKNNSTWISSPARLERATFGWEDFPPDSNALPIAPRRPFI